MNFRQIDCFLAVARTLSFSDAARELYLSQSTVSAQIIALENELGFSLVDRDQHHVRLTRAGEYLMGQWTRLVSSFDVTVGRAKAIAADEGEQVCLGYDGPLSECWIGDAVARFHDIEPHVGLRLSRKPIGELTDMLAQGAVDAVVTVRSEIPDGSFGFERLGSAGPCVFVARNHRLVGMPRVTAADLAGEPLVSPYASLDASHAGPTVAALASHGVDLSGAQPVSDGDTAFMAVQAGLGVFVASHLCDEFAGRYDVRSIDLDAGLAPAELVFAWKDDGPLIRSLARCVEYAASLGKCSQERTGRPASA